MAADRINGLVCQLQIFLEDICQSNSMNIHKAVIQWQSSLNDSSSGMGRFKFYTIS